MLRRLVRSPPTSATVSSSSDRRGSAASTSVSLPLSSNKSYRNNQKHTRTQNKTYILTTTAILVIIILITLWIFMPINLNTLSPINQLKNTVFGAKCSPPENVPVAENLAQREFNFQRKRNAKKQEEEFSTDLEDAEEFLECWDLRGRLEYVLRESYALVTNYERQNLTELGKRLRAFRLLWVAQQTKYANCFDASLSGKVDVEKTKDTFKKMQKLIFPWLKRDVMDMYADLKGRGVVVCGGDYHFVYLKTLIFTIRKVLTSDIPIDVIYSGEHDLSSENRFVLQGMAKNVKTMDLQSVVDISLIPVEGWDLKPFALAASRFEETILIDADVLLLQTPDMIFNSRAYTSSSAAFFHDRTTNAPKGWDLPLLLRLLQPHPSAEACQLGSVTGFTGYEMESGFVAVHNKRRLIGVLASAKLFDTEERKVFEKYAGGDKEAYWLGFETVQDRYTFLPYFPGNIGTKESGMFSQWICGRMLHFDESGAPYWWNGGVRYADRREKDYQKLPLIIPVDYDDGGKFGESVPIWIENTAQSCTMKSKRGIRELHDPFRAVAERIIMTYVHYENGEKGDPRL